MEEGIPFFRFLAPSDDDGDDASKRVWLERLRGRFDVNVSAKNTTVIAPARLLPLLARHCCSVEGGSFGDGKEEV